MKAVISSGDKQYVVAEKEQILVDLLENVKAGDKIEPTVLATIDGKNSKVGTPEVKDIKVVAKVVEPLVKGDKVVAIRFEAKKRVNKVRGMRHQRSRIEIVSIK